MISAPFLFRKWLAKANFKEGVPCARSLNRFLQSTVRLRCSAVRRQALCAEAWNSGRICVRVCGRIRPSSPGAVWNFSCSGAAGAVGGFWSVTRACWKRRSAVPLRYRCCAVRDIPVILTVAQALHRLRLRMVEEREFPHEIGVFLGIRLRMCRRSAGSAARTASCADTGKSTETWSMRGRALPGTMTAANVCAAESGAAGRWRSF